MTHISKLSELVKFCKNSAKIWLNFGKQLVDFSKCWRNNCQFCETFHFRILSDAELRKSCRILNPDLKDAAK